MKMINICAVKVLEKIYVIRQRQCANEKIYVKLKVMIIFIFSRYINILLKHGQKYEEES
jgi:hypothetical protein